MEERVLAHDVVSARGLGAEERAGGRGGGGRRGGAGGVTGGVRGRSNVGMQENRRRTGGQAQRK